MNETRIDHDPDPAGRQAAGEQRAGAPRSTSEQYGRARKKEDRRRRVSIKHRASEPGERIGDGPESREYRNTGGGIGKREDERSGIGGDEDEEWKRDPVADPEDEVAEGRRGRRNGEIGHEKSRIKV